MIISFQIVVAPLWTIVQSLPDHFAVTMDAATPNGHVMVLTLNWAASGDWIFKAVDDAGVDTGTIDSWQLQLTVNEPCDAVGLIFRDGFEGGDTSLWSNTAP